LKLTVELDGEAYTLDLRANAANSEYTVRGAKPASGTASVVEVMPGVFSVLLAADSQPCAASPWDSSSAARSFTVHVAPKGEDLELWVGTQRHTVSVADARDRSAKRRKLSAAGPMEIRAQMPGRVIKLLAALNASVRAGQGIIVVEAMKMQNEMKSPKDGIVSKILVSEGAAVVAGETLVVIE
jgi:biotin carboxyl carrier protein